MPGSTFSPCFWVSVANQKNSKRSDIDFGKETPSAVLNYAVDIEGVDKDSTACKVEVFDAEGNKVAEAAGTQGTPETTYKGCCASGPLRPHLPSG